MPDLPLDFEFLYLEDGFAFGTSVLSPLQASLHIHTSSLLFACVRFLNYSRRSNSFFQLDSFNNKSKAGFFDAIALVLETGFDVPHSPKLPEFAKLIFQVNAFIAVALDLLLP